MIRYKIVFLIGVFCSAVCSVGIAQTQTEYGLQKWSMFHGRIQIDLPSEWNQASGEHTNELFFAGENTQIRFTRTGGRGFMRMILFGNRLETDEIQIVQDSLVAICNHAGLELLRAKTVVIDGRNFVFAEGGYTKFDRQIVARVGATLMDDRLLLVLFTGSGKIKADVLFEARFAINSLVCREAELNHDDETEAAKTSKSGDFVGLGPYKTGEIFRPVRDLETREIPGYGVSLELPVDFRESTMFPGFFGPYNSLKIYLTPSMLPYGLARAQFTPSVFWRWEGVLMDSQDIEIDGRSGVLTLSEHGSPGNVYYRRMLMTGNKERSITIIGFFNWGSLGDVSNTLRSSLMTVKWDSSVAPHSLDGLGFSFTEGTHLKVHRRVHDSVILAPEGGVGFLQNLETYLSIQSFQNPAPVENFPAFAEECAETLPQVAWLSVNSTSEIVISGSMGIELLGTVTLVENEQKRDFYQVIVVRDSVVFLVQGFQKPHAPINLMGEFELVAKSLELHTPSGGMLKN